MSFPYYPNLKEEKIESLETQHEFLNILRLRHLQWMNDTNESVVEGEHREIAGLIEQLTDHYTHLLQALK